jgi:hypothetical protein
MKVHTLSPTDAARHFATHRITLEASDVAALGASATGTIAIVPTSGTFRAGTAFRFAGLRLVTAFDFSDTGITSLLIEIGDGGDTDRLLAQTEIAVDGTEITYYLEGKVTQPYVFTAADTVDAKFTAANGGTPTLAECTVGEVEILLYVEDRADLARPSGAIL